MISRLSHEQLDKIVATAMDAIIVADEGQRVILFNTASEKLFGYTAAEAIGSPIDRFIPERFRSAHHEHVRRYGEEGVTRRTMGTLGQIWALRADGREFPIEASISSIPVAEGTRQKFFTVIMRDISERRRLEEAAFRFAAIVESSDDGILVADLDGIIRAWNKGAERIFGFSEAEIVGRSIALLAPPELRDEQERLFRKLKGGERLEQFAAAGLRKDGARLAVSLTTSLVRDGGGRISCAIALDTESRKKRCVRVNNASAWWPVRLR
jgi:PAS domain S-box-containing protein